MVVDQQYKTDPGGRPKSDISVLALHISMLQNVVGRLGRQRKASYNKPWDFMGSPQNVTRGTSENDDSNADILAAFDDAIADGVDIISLSVGGFSPGDHFNDSIATGAFHAMKKGLLASISAGNSGPDPATITNYSPWFLYVAASTIDRKIVTRVKLGNRAFHEASKMHGTVPSKQTVSERLYIQQFPFTSFSTGAEKPTATILKSIQRDDGLVPSVVSFSSRGPSPIANDIIKPDLAAPGADILAAWSQRNTQLTSSLFPPTWSPAAIKSALMTTAFSMSAETNPEAEFGYGSGHINPMKAINPGLIYDAGEEDYVKFLCGLDMTLGPCENVIQGTWSSFACGYGQGDPCRTLDVIRQMYGILNFSPSKSPLHLELAAKSDPLFHNGEKLHGNLLPNCRAGFVILE
ncbi:hypothetical protein DKX38_016283 [Salix brachista]|uniref:Peptidase S8/S53 domain-containing protein n=1 Tax=Salix brachista TaxID=2182728 RepID=A0A5N5L847_9ROSI|nr:hypothetical protein DKX38_016283 [Salix brachista]